MALQRPKVGAERPSAHRALRREGVGLIEHQMQRLPILVVEPFGKLRHEAGLLAFAEMREVEHDREAFFHYDVGDDLARAHLEGHVAVFAADDHDRQPFLLAVG
jgi:hypothetical protein